MARLFYAQEQPRTEEVTTPHKEITPTECSGYLVAEDFIGLGNLLELFLSLTAAKNATWIRLEHRKQLRTTRKMTHLLFVAGVAVRVPLHGLLPVRLLDAILIGVLLHAQNLVIVWTHNQDSPAQFQRLNANDSVKYAEDPARTFAHCLLVDLT